MPAAARWPGTTVSTTPSAIYVCWYSWPRAVLAWLVWGRDAIGAVWMALPAAVFVVLIVAHERVLRARRAVLRAAAHYERALARMDGQWVGCGETGERFLDASHPYAADLDLFGRGSLFELLSTAAHPHGRRNPRRLAARARRSRRTEGASGSGLGTGPQARLARRLGRARRGRARRRASSGTGGLGRAAAHAGLGRRAHRRIRHPMPGGGFRGVFGACKAGAIRSSPCLP